MTVTRRGFIKRALTAAALALVPSLPGLPKVAQEGRKVGRVIALPLHTSKTWNRAVSDLEILEQHCPGVGKAAEYRVVEYMPLRECARLGPGEVSE